MNAKVTQNSEHERNGEGATTPSGKSNTGHGPGFNPDEDLVYRLKSVIDSSNKFANRLADLTIGYSAGAGIPNAEAKNAIEDRFTRRIGLTPAEYLESRFASRRQHREGLNRSSRKDFDREL